MLIKFIEGMLEYYGRDRKAMNDHQVANIIEDILSKYSYLRLEDVCLCFKRARQSPNIYGKFYGIIDGSVIMNWFAVYDRERDDYINSTSDYKPQTDTTGWVTREDYMEELEIKVACGDMYANQYLIAALSYEKGRMDRAIQTRNYNDHRKGKMSEKYDYHPLGKNMYARNKRENT
ncbi:hypothetical protein [Bacteroides reticulotermitis]|uniref:hypothetical protein n=1 Tax=Bacteroides reticulotermitis TaxID=1133319 RepID=UPI003A86CA46